MDTIFSPANIGILLHCHTKSEPIPNYEENVHIQRTVQTWLIMDILVKDGDVKGSYTTALRGKAWVQALCNTPPPTVAFVDEAGRVLKL